MFTRKPEPKPAQTPSLLEQFASMPASQSPPQSPAQSPPQSRPSPPMPLQPIVPSVNSTGPASSMQSQSTIGQDLSIEGQGIVIRCQGSLTINGSVHAELHGREISIGERGTVQGSVTADAVDVWGRVGGTIKGARVVLHSSAQVDGDIHATTLSIEDGAYFEGRSRKADDAAVIAPQLTVGAASSDRRAD